MTHDFDPSCAGCKRSQGDDGVEGGIILLANDLWVVNHYGGEGRFLGWLALQPRVHRMKIQEVSDDEMRALGPILKTLDRLLAEYWKETFGPTDELLRVHFLYFFESVHDVRPTKFHLHLHLIPRPKRLDPLVREYTDRKVGDTEKSEINAWKTLRVQV